ncbi:lipopolysaccharide biosynthesis protein [Ochrobactrum sp. P6BS-III]|uniref:GumC family protein n=1 Tax=unclassified Ochrobactrum TaxID=239106 RepID=UPI00099466F7|nr:uncharacterized protein involved in exopolysaccharide biosynthesis [Ochrobactrum sp. P6BSIII]OOL18548.1 lipopolysaccharide biosynthesis protein [Ochrobactrum sp. P6BS-III]
MYTLRDLASKAQLPRDETRGAETLEQWNQALAQNHAPSYPRAASVSAPVSGPVPEEAVADRPSAPHLEEPEAKSTGDGLMLPEIDLWAALEWVRARWIWIVILAVAGALAGLAYGMTAKPRYTAYTDMLVPPSGLQLLPNDIYAQSLQADSQILDIESKMKMLVSGNVLRRVVQNLNLQNDAEFVPPPASFDLRALLGLGKPKDASDDTLTAVRALSQRIVVTRPERSYLVTIGVWTDNPEKSVKVADALAKSFQEEVAEADADGAGRAAAALSERLTSLQKAATDAEEKVAAFRRAHGLQTTGGELVSAQSMAQINTKLLDAKSRQTDASTRYNELTRDTGSPVGPASTLQSPTMTNLRSQYATLKQRYDALTMTYGPRYPELINTQRQIAGLEQQIAAERARILQSAKVDLDQANAVVDALNAQAATARSAVALDNDAQVQLSDLERDMTAKVSIYNTFLTRSTETHQRQQLDATNIRVISTAIPPISRSWPPRTVLLGAGGGFVGMGLGVALALALGYLGAWRRNRESRV